MSLISQITRKLSKNIFLLTLFVSFSCKETLPDKPILLTPSGDEILISLATNIKEQQQGLSGVKSSEFAANRGHLFVYQHDDYRSFWMPDTYFNLDIFFLNRELKILSIERDVPHHPGYSQPPMIKKTPSHFCRHVLEMRSDSPIARKLKVGDVLKIKGKINLLQKQ